MSAFTPTKEQKSVINAPVDQRTIVIAGPGTGKTETVARRLAQLVGKGNIRPSQILVLSFSRSAVKALVNRIRSLKLTDIAALEELRFLSVRTFDSWTFRTLRFMGEEATGLLQNDFNENIELLVSKLNKLEDEDALEVGHPRLGAIRHLVVDEFQDLAGIRAELVQKLITILSCSERPGEPCGFTILGDPNQAIYDFSLANSDYDGSCGSSSDLTSWIKDKFEDDLVTERLSKNHRSSKGIAGLVEEAAEILFNAADDDLDAVELMEEFLEERLDQTDPDELFDYIASNSDDGLAVLCRSNSQTIEIMTQMQYLEYTKNRPLQGLYMTAGNPPDRLPAWVAKLLHKFKAGNLTRNNFLKIFDLIFPDGSKDAPCGGDAGASWNLLLGYARTGEGETSLDMADLRKRIVWPDALPDDEGVADARVTLATIHQSKGLEYQKVKIVKANPTTDGGFDNTDEEGRVLFVGMSRAKDELTMLEFPSKYPFFHKSFADGRKRWQRWMRDMTHLELGCDGDVDEESIIRADLMGGTEIVADTQKFLAENENGLVGEHVALVKSPIPGKINKFVYAIRLGSDGNGRCLGFLRQHVTFDLLRLRTGGIYRLPGRIFGLRVGAVTTSVSNRDLHVTVPSPWRDSKFWLSVIIHGIGKYK